MYLVYVCIHCLILGVNSFNLTMSNSDLDDVSLYKTLRHCAKFGALAQIVAENKDITKLVSAKIQCCVCHLKSNITCHNRQSN